MNFNIFKDFGLVHTVVATATAILGLKIPLPHEHLHVVPWYSFVTSTIDETNTNEVFLFCIRNVSNSSN